LLKKYIEENEAKMKELFAKADDETKNELRELYILINS
jgi:SpoVK/Ycf46/Vps4 family AAA+-type ATPase